MGIWQELTGIQLLGWVQQSQGLAGAGIGPLLFMLLPHCLLGVAFQEPFRTSELRGMLTDGQAGAGSPVQAERTGPSGHFASALSQQLPLVPAASLPFPFYFMGGEGNWFKSPQSQGNSKPAQRVIHTALPLSN